MSLKQLLVALILSLPLISAHACLPVLLVWYPGVPKPKIVFDGLIVEERYARWQPRRSGRTIIVQPKVAIRGVWKAHVELPVPCDESHPMVGETVLIAGQGNKGGWMLIADREGFMDFLKSRPKLGRQR